ncbi:hypothetical protein ABVT39_015551 [Epinephelus coioides]
MSSMEESGETDQMAILQEVPPIDIRPVLSAVSSGSEIMKSLDESGVITRKQRITQVQILVSFLIEKFGDRPTNDIKVALALSLVQMFPSLNDGSDCGYVS